MRKFNKADKGNMNDTVSLTVEEKPHCRHQGNMRGSLKTKPHLYTCERTNVCERRKSELRILQNVIPDPKHLTRKAI